MYIYIYYIIYGFILAKNISIVNMIKKIHIYTRDPF